MKKLLIVFTLVFCLSKAFAQEKYCKTSVSVELDPAPFILNGYSFSFKYSPTEFPETAFMISVYGSDFPDAMMSSNNKGRGWTDLQMKTSYAFFVERFLRNDRTGFYFGPSVFLYNKSVASATFNERAVFTTLYPNIRAGYVCYPSEGIDLYINPWFNFGSEINMDKKNELHGIIFEPGRFYYIAAVHIGYSLNW